MGVCVCVGGLVSGWVGGGWVGVWVSGGDGGAVTHRESALRRWGGGGGHSVMHWMHAGWLTGRLAIHLQKAAARLAEPQAAAH